MLSSLKTAQPSPNPPKPLARSIPPQVRLVVKALPGKRWFAILKPVTEPYTPTRNTWVMETEPTSSPQDAKRLGELYAELFQTSIVSTELPK